MSGKPSSGGNHKSNSSRDLRQAKQCVNTIDRKPKDQHCEREPNHLGSNKAHQPSWQQERAYGNLPLTCDETSTQLRQPRCKQNQQQDKCRHCDTKRIGQRSKVKRLR